MEPEICPPWWPRIIWDLHQYPSPSPINYPPVVEDIMSALAIHTFSYKLRDQGVAQQIRAMTEEQLSNSVRNMSKLHDEAVARGQEGT